MDLTTHISPDVFIHLPPHLSASNPNNEPTRLIFLLPGNPGLLSYYHTFLSLLASSSEAGASYAISAFSLGGFEGAHAELGEYDEELLFPDAVAARRSTKVRGEEQGWWGLQDQVDLAVARVDAVVGRLQRRQGQRDGYREGNVQVTLMGHSVGAYLALEVVRARSERAWREREPQPEVDERGVLGVGSVAEAGGRGAVEWEVEACALLAPTIVHIAKSPSGLKAALLMAAVGSLPSFVQSAAWALTWGLSDGAMQWVVAKFMGLAIEDDGVKTTVRFLRSEGGVRQALEMAKQEMVSIADDNWGPEVWGFGEVVSDCAWAGQGGPQLFFLFAKTDHWVADKTREEIESRRGRKDGRGMLLIDEKDGLVHAWCLRQNQAVSEYVKPWLAQIRSGGIRPP